MNSTLRMAWRNAWRNPRRTGILVTAVAVGIAGTLLTMALNFGMIFQMVELAIETDLGHVQVHANGWDANPELGIRLQDGGARAVDALEADPRVRAMFDEVTVRWPNVPNLYRVLGNAPDMLRAWLDMAWPLRTKPATSRRIRELMILAGARASEVSVLITRAVPR